MELQDPPSPQLHDESMRPVPPRDEALMVAPPADPPVSFWQQPWAQDIVAFSTSLFFHAAVIVILLILGKELPRLTTPVQEQVIIPDATIIEGAEVGGIPNPGLGGDPNLSAAQSNDPNVPVAEGWSDKRSETLSQNLMGGGGSEGEIDSMIGIGPRAGLGSGQGTGSGRGDAVGAGSGDGGGIAPFGVPGGGAGMGPKSPFMGISGNAKY